MEKHLILYTMEGCPFCVIMKSKLNELNIKYVERDIDKEDKEFDLFSEIVGNDAVPSFMIIETDGKTHNAEFFAPERDYNLIDEGIEIIKEHYGKTNI